MDFRQERKDFVWLPPSLQILCFPDPHDVHGHVYSLKLEPGIIWKVCMKQCKGKIIDSPEGLVKGSFLQTPQTQAKT